MVRFHFSNQLIGPRSRRGRGRYLGDGLVAWVTSFRGFSNKSIFSAILHSTGSYNICSTPLSSCRRHATASGPTGNNRRPSHGPPNRSSTQRDPSSDLQPPPSPTSCKSTTRVSSVLDHWSTIPRQRDTSHFQAEQLCAPAPDL